MALRNAGESLRNSLMKAMILPDMFNPLSIYVTHSSKELTLSEF